MSKSRHANAARMRFKLIERWLIWFYRPDRDGPPRRRSSSTLTASGISASSRFTTTLVPRWFGLSHPPGEEVRSCHRILVDSEHDVSSPQARGVTSPILLTLSRTQPSRVSPAATPIVEAGGRGSLPQFSPPVKRSQVCSMLAIGTW